MNAPTHRPIGTAFGVFAAAYRAQNQQAFHQVLETIGGAIGGYGGSMLPDRFEPANCWSHRKFCHSWATFIAGATFSVATVRVWEKYCRDEAQATANRRAAITAQTGNAPLSLWLLEAVWRIAAGLMAGLLAGYASHLILDATTPAGLPILG